MFAPFQPALLAVAAGTDPVVYALIGAGAGMYFFYRGFRMLQRKRLIEDTPTSKIRSASMGLVEVSGLAVGPYTIPAPLTGYQCYLYRTVAWQLKTAGKSKEWKKVAEERFHVPFYLRDETGQVLIEPGEAELDIHRDLHSEYRTNLFAAGDSAPAPVWEFLGRHGVDLDAPTKLEEYCIKPKNALFIVGTLGENPGIEVRKIASPSDYTWLKKSNAAAVPADVPKHAPPDEAELKARAAFAAAMGFHAPAQMPHPATPAQKPVKPPVVLDEAEKSRRELFAASLLGANAPVPAKAAAYMGVSTASPASASNSHPDPTVDGEEEKRRQLAMASLFGAPAAAAAPVGTTPPSAPAAVTAAATPSSAPAAAAVESADHFDLHPPVVLTKGEHNPTFLISWHSQRDLLATMAWKSALYIWGGPALTLACVAFLLSRLGLW